jgi:amino acid transporter
VACDISVLCASSRTTWAFARDRALPFHHKLSHISTCASSPVPLNAILLTTAVQLLLGLIYLGSSTAFNAFIDVAVVCLGASNAMPVAVSLCNGRKDMEGVPFSLGRWGIVLNGITVLWILFAIVLFSMPAVVPVTKVSMSALSDFLGVRGFYSSALLRFRLC